MEIFGQGPEQYAYTRSTPECQKQRRSNPFIFQDLYFAECLKKAGLDRISLQNINQRGK
jgi:hypothetical protein